jgi:hypothetical protein
VTRTRIWIAAAAVGAVVAAVAAPGAQAHVAPSRASGLGVMIPAHGLAPLTNANQTSLNWSGYAVNAPAGQKITAVDTTFVVPAVDDTTPGLAATWTGIGGYTTQDLIQAGVSENAPSAVLGYNAWYELLPASETAIGVVNGGDPCTGDVNCTVNPGDQMKVTITQQSTGSWLISMSDAGHWTYSKTVSYASSNSSAEWILEAPTLVVQTVLPMMQDTLFGSGDTYQLNGTGSNTIAQGNPDSITLVGASGLFAEGQPSPLRADGSSFTACAYATSCP